MKSVRAQHPHVFDLVSFAARFLYSFIQPLDSEEIFLWELLSQLAKKRAIATAQIHMQRRIAPEKLPDIKALSGQLWDQFDHGGKLSSRRGQFNLYAVI